MKIIEALKKTKELQVKAKDLRDKINLHCAYLSVETPVYPNQKEQVRKWLQAHEDLTQEIGRLLERISRTNNATQVTIEFGDACYVTKSITSWVHRRRTLTDLDLNAWKQLGDRGLREGKITSSSGGEATVVSIVRCYDPLERDKKVEMYTQEPSLIDRTLEVVNATTDLLE